MRYQLKLNLLSLIPLIAGLLISIIILSNLIDKQSKKHLNFIRVQQENAIANEIKGRIESAYSILEYCYNHGYSKEECKDILNTLRYGDNNYIWVHMFNPEKSDDNIMLVHPNKNLINKNMSDVIDLDIVEKLYYEDKIYSKDEPEVSEIKPTAIFLAFNDVCRKNGDGVVKYFWPKIIDGKAGEIGYLKMSYVKYFSPWDWVLGTGEYADYIDALISDEKERYIRRNSKLLHVFFTTYLIVSLVLIFITFIVSKKIANRLKSYEDKLIESRQQALTSEKRLFDIAFSSGDFIWEIDKNFHFTFVEGDIDKILCYTKNDILGKSIFDYLADKEKDKIKNDIMIIFEEKKPLYNLESENQTATGDVVTLLTNACPVISESGELLGYRGITRNITAQKKESALREQLEYELQQTQKLDSIGSLAAGIAHEINTPIQFISDNVSFINNNLNSLIELVRLYTQQKQSTEQISEEVSELIEVIDIDFLMEEIPLALSQSQEGLSHVASIVGAMKSFSHTDQKEKEMADINKAISDAVIITKNEWKHHVDDVSCEFDNSLPFIPCYVGMLKQVFLNLIVNAVHAIEDAQNKHVITKGYISIKTYQNEEYVAVEITDNGIGIPEEIRHRVFDQFFTTKDVGKGTGQGLSIAHNAIVDKHKGRLTLSSEINKGTTFCIMLPIAPIDNPTDILQH